MHPPLIKWNNTSLGGLKTTCNLRSSLLLFGFSLISGKYSSIFTCNELGRGRLSCYGRPPDRPLLIVGEVDHLSYLALAL